MGNIQKGREPVCQPLQPQRGEETRRILRETPSLTPGIADAIVMKDRNLFFLCGPDGAVPLKNDHAMGLYYHDCRYLRGYELRLGGKKPLGLVSTGARGYMSLFDLTNPEIQEEDGRLTVRRDDVGIRWLRVLSDDELSLYDEISFRNFGFERIELPIALAFRPGFDDVFAVRSLMHELPGVSRRAKWVGGALVFAYEGCDGLLRSLTVRCWPPPDRRRGMAGHFHMAVDPQRARKLLVAIGVTENGREAAYGAPRVGPDVRVLRSKHEESVDRWLRHQTEVRSSSMLLDSVIERSLCDLRMLQASMEGRRYYAAGVPWFCTLFGRDSLITAIQTLAFRPAIAEETLRVLAAYQGKETDPWREEEPGKILHELRVGELARTGEIPHSPYYGSVDATPLFLVLLARYASWRGDLALFEKLRPNVEAALAWIDSRQKGGGRYLSYVSTSSRGLENQGWRDSRDGVLNGDGTLAVAPIALVEVQAYVYLAKTLIADLYRRSGDPERARELEAEALELRRHFNRDFWLKDGQCYALALQAGDRPADVLTTNAGYALWGGIADTEKARKTVQRLMAKDMFSGWGIRTLSEKEVVYNPIGYHLGTVWPHDNSIVAAGFRRYGFAEAACDVFNGMMRAAMNFPDYRLPELFAGYSKEDYGVPVPYPLANKPQAWAAGAIPYMLQVLLGLEAEAFEHRLRVVRPILPEFISWVELHRVPVGRDRVDLRFERTASGVAVEVLGKSGRVDVVVEL